MSKETVPVWSVGLYLVVAPGRGVGLGSRGALAAAWTGSAVAVGVHHHLHAGHGDRADDHPAGSGRRCRCGVWCRSPQCFCSRWRASPATPPIAAHSKPWQQTLALNWWRRANRPSRVQVDRASTCTRRRTSAWNWVITGPPCCVSQRGRDTLVIGVDDTGSALELALTTPP